MSLPSAVRTSDFALPLRVGNSNLITFIPIGSKWIRSLNILLHVFSRESGLEESLLDRPKFIETLRELLVLSSKS